MKWLKRIGIGVGILFALIAAIVVWQFYHFKLPSESFDPKCGETDTACLTWQDFRRKHSYPYQTFAAKRIDADRLVLVISEPGPALSKPALLELVRHTFGPDLIKVERRNWGIAIDGWVEDLVLTLRASGTAGSDPLADRRLRDQIALMHQALFGTTFGGDVETIDSAKPVASRTRAPALQVTAGEITSWIEESPTQWHPIRETDGVPQSWGALDTGATIGTFMSSDRTIVMLTFPTALLHSAKNDRGALAPLRVPFRQFAVGSDAVFGGFWTRGGQTTVVGRVRRTALTQLPPLRFETFELLATQTGDELAHSFERTALFAGKLMDGDNFAKDWAPIFLSPALVDTEFGALLNITDQMLKSWSSAGRIEYLYFDYPKPAQFPFKNRPISEIVNDQGGKSVLFNWNTSGSTVVVKTPTKSVLAINTTTALPVTYGADGKVKAAGGADMLQYEEEAFAYFAGLGDPNLARVAQYTAIYQMFRAIARDTGAVQNEPGEPVQSSYPTSRKLLASSATDLISKIERGALQSKSAKVSTALASFVAFRNAHPEMTAEQLGPILADRMSPESTAISMALRKRADMLSAEKTAHNAAVSQAMAHKDDLTEDRATQLAQRKAELERQDTQLRDEFEEWNTARTDLALIAKATQDISATRARFLSEANRLPNGSIKTPSSVLSWSQGDALESEGGHNLSARTLVFEQTADGSGMTLTSNADGQVVLRYDAAHAKAVEARAGELARAVEHKGADTIEQLMPIIERAATVRTRTAALALNATPAPEIGSAEGFGRLGTRAYADKEKFVDDLRLMASQNECCIFVARSKNETAFITEINLKPPPTSTAYEARDALSLAGHLKAVAQRTERKRQRAIIFLDAPPEHVDAMVQSIKAGNTNQTELITVAHTLNGSGKRGGADGISGIAQPDMNGRMGVLRGLANAVDAKARKLLVALGIVQPRNVWGTAHTEILPDGSLDTILQAARWNKETDGIPKAVRLTFDGPTTSLPDVTLVGGFRPADAPMGARQLERASSQVLEQAASQGASVAQYLMTVRSELSKLPPGQMQRLILVAGEQEAEALYTQLQQ